MSKSVHLVPLICGEMMMIFKNFPHFLSFLFFYVHMCRLKMLRPGSPSPFRDHLRHLLSNNRLERPFSSRSHTSVAASISKDGNFEFGTFVCDYKFHN